MVYGLFRRGSVRGGWWNSEIYPTENHLKWDNRLSHNHHKYCGLDHWDVMRAQWKHVLLFYDLSRHGNGVTEPKGERTPP